MKSQALILVLLSIPLLAVETPEKKDLMAQSVDNLSSQLLDLDLDPALIGPGWKREMDEGKPLFRRYRSPDGVWVYVEIGHIAPRPSPEEMQSIISEENKGWAIRKISDDPLSYEVSYGGMRIRKSLIGSYRLDVHAFIDENGDDVRKDVIDVYTKKVTAMLQELEQTKMQAEAASKSEQVGVGKK